MDTPRDLGGATFINDAVFGTIYQFVAVPEERTIWLKAPGFEDWKVVDLGALSILKK